MIINRPPGENDSERYLMKMCDKSFLRLWTWRNLYYIDGNIKKEICDVLVVFRNKIIIFSDKYIEFGKYEKTDFKRIDVLWKRWYKKAVSNSVDQIYGAERNLKNNPENIYLDKECETKFPVTISFTENTKIYRVAVAHGARDACKDLFNGGSGSLILTNDVDTAGSPFTITYEAFGKGFVHVLDDVTLDIILNHLDTITDFTDYLDEKEKFMVERRIICTGEENLLACYLSNFDENKRRYHFNFPEEFDSIIIDDLIYSDFISKGKYIFKKENEKISYLWDDILDRFIHHAITGTSFHGNCETVEDHNKLLEILAFENRNRRTVLSTVLTSFINKFSNSTDSDIKSRSSLPNENDNQPHYFFLLVSKRLGADKFENRKRRREIIEDYSIIYKYLYKNAKNIIIYATEMEDDVPRSEDIVHLDCKIWTEEMQETAKERYEYYKSIGYFNEKKEYFGSYSSENGEVLFENMKGNFRNKPCPCGSGKKYKKCCGK
jgi:hypothetical protein